MLTSSILTTTQQDRSLFSEGVGGAAAELLLDPASEAGGVDLGLVCCSEMKMRYLKFRKLLVTEAKIRNLYQLDHDAADEKWFS